MICEKCWTDSAFAGNHTAEYERLLKEREGSPCTPEQQAGECGTRCQACNRRTLHQYTRICVNHECKKYGVEI